MKPLRLRHAVARCAGDAGSVGEKCGVGGGVGVSRHGAMYAVEVGVAHEGAVGVGDASMSYRRHQIGADVDPVTDWHMRRR